MHHLPKTILRMGNSWHISCLVLHPPSKGRAEMFLNAAAGLIELSMLSCCPNVCGSRNSPRLWYPGNRVWHLASGTYDWWITYDYILSSYICIVIPLSFVPWYLSNPWPLIKEVEHHLKTKLVLVGFIQRGHFGGFTVSRMGCLKDREESCLFVRAVSLFCTCTQNLLMPLDWQSF